MMKNLLFPLKSGVHGLVFLFGLAAISGVAFSAGKDTLFIEAEGFEDKGGWVVDQQYMDQMGSPVLLAHGLGTPVADAITNITFPQSGQYRVFVRTRNWVARWTPEYAPGQFQVLLGGKALEETFGTKNDAWFWHFGGTVEVKPEKLTQTLILRDLTGFDGRCDAIIFTADPNFTPPEDAGPLRTLRRKMLGLTENPLHAPPIPEGPFDLVVNGGGIAGCSAAVGAARLGLKVALIQNRPVLGGNNSSEVRVHLMGRTHFEPYPRIGDLVRELDPLQIGNAQLGHVYKDEKKLALVQAEENLSLYLSTHAFAVDIDPEAPEDAKRIRAVIAKNIETNAEHRFEGRWFVDATGDGNIGFLSGAQWRMGRESKDQTGESLAPEQSDSLVMGASTQWYSVPSVDESGTPVPSDFPSLPWGVQFNERSIQPALDGEWDWETGMNLDQIADAERIRDHALRAVYGHWSYMKNHADPEWIEKTKNRKLGWVAFVAGKRESRRIMGDVILLEQHIVHREIFEDACVSTTWTIDLHYPTDHQREHFPGEEFRTWADHKRIEPYMIPYRCFYSRDVENLFMAGRCISVTHVALGTIRVQRTGGMMGEVVAMAASLCKKHSTTPRGVYREHLEELKELMKEGVGRPELSGPAWIRSAGENFARKATIRVSGLYNGSQYPAASINDGKIEIGTNEGRWVGNESVEPHFVELNFERPIEVNALRVVSGQAGPKTPIRDFVLQYRKSGDASSPWIDIESSRAIGNLDIDFSARFEPVRSQFFRLWITASPGNLARLWELELYRINESSR